MINNNNDSDSENENENENENDNKNENNNNNNNNVSFLRYSMSSNEMGVKGHSRALRVVSFDRLCMVSY